LALPANGPGDIDEKYAVHDIKGLKISNGQYSRRI